MQQVRVAVRAWPLAPEVWVSLLGVVVCVPVGMLAASRTTLAASLLLFVAAGVALALAGRWAGSPYCLGAFILLGGYICLSRGFSGLHLPLGGIPVYLGELGLMFLLPGALHRLRERPLGAPVVLLGVWMAFSALLTLPHISAYGLHAIRDAAIWYYGLYAAVGMTVWRMLDRLTIRRWWTVVFLVGLVAAPLGIFDAYIPSVRLPISDVSLFATKHDTIGLHLLGAAAFFLAGLHPAATSSLRWATPLVLAVAVGYIAVVQQRASFIGLAGIFGLLLVLRQWRTVVIGTGTGLALLAALWVLDFELDRYQDGRTVTTQAIIERQVSTFAFVTDPDAADDAQHAGTIAWRLDWWQALIEEGLEDPQILLLGRGYGPDLRQAAPDPRGSGNYNQGEDEGRPVRSPHNIAVTILARSGVVGLALWLLVLGLSGRRIFRATLASRRAGDPDVRFGIWFMMYLALILLISLFGVVLEAPHGAVPFFFTLGLALAWADDHLAPSAPVGTDLTRPEGGRRAAFR